MPHVRQSWVLGAVVLASVSMSTLTGQEKGGGDETGAQLCTRGIHASMDTGST